MLRIFATFLLMIVSLTTLGKAQEAEAVVVPESRPETVPANSTLNQSWISDFILPPARAETAETAEALPERPRVALPEARPGSVPNQAPIATTVSSAPTPRAEAPAPPTSSRGHSACLAALDRLNVVFDEVNVSGNGGCGVPQGVEVSSFNGVRLSPPGAMRCELALATAQWLRQSVVPEVRSRLRTSVATVHQVSTYSCRSRPSGRLSEHATGNAIDIARLTLANNQVISVLEDWRDQGRRTRVLRTIAASSCDYYSVVLTPESDAAHQDHFHLDLGGWVSCDG